ncbi:hypothetical protein Tco_1456554 [Tanacetum coccineum]
MSVKKSLQASFLKDIRASDYDNSDHRAPHDKSCYLLIRKDRFDSHQGFEWGFGGGPMDQRSYHRTSSWENHPKQFKQDDSLPQILKFLGTNRQKPFGQENNKAKMVLEEQEGRDTDFARLEAVRIFIAYAAHKSFPIYQMTWKRHLLSMGPPEGGRFMLLSPEGKLQEPGLQIHQSPKGIFINQAKYALEILKKHNMDQSVTTIGTPLATKPKLEGYSSLGENFVTGCQETITALQCLQQSRVCGVISASCAQVVRLGINPMIQPELEDLPKDNPKLEIAVLRMKKKCMDKGCKQRSPPHNLRQKPGQYICCQNHMLIADIEDDIMDPVMQCTTLPSHSGFSQQKLE